MRRTQRLLAVSVVLVVLAATACIPVRPNTRCRAGQGWGQNGDLVYACKDGRWRAVMTKGQAAQILLQLLGPAPGQVVRPLGLGYPKVTNTADPTVFTEGGVHYIYATTNYRHVPVRAVQNIDTPERGMEIAATEAMPGVPAWAAHPEIWAPTVGKIGGRYVMFFTAHRQGAPDPSNDQCIGRAWADSPLGPFAPDPTPFSCGADGIHGALDPSLYFPPDGRVFLLSAQGGSQTNIFSMQLDGAANPASGWSALVTRGQPWEEWFLENPSMVFDGNEYILAYSAGRWDTDRYVTGIARCRTPQGPCTTRSDGPWLSSLPPVIGPGGLEFFFGADGICRVIFHAYPQGNVNPVGARQAFISQVRFDPWPRLTT
jgi:hypothetical protein